MQSEKFPQVRIPRVTRRGFLEGASAIVSAAAAVTPARAASGDVIAYVGAATSAPRNTGGIYSYYVDQSDGSLTPKSALTNILNPNYLVIHPNRNYMYAVNSIANFAGTSNGSVTALSIDQGTGDLKVMNVVNAQGGGTTHVSVDPTGKWVFVANYGGRNAAVLPVRADGSLGEATDVVEITGPLGPRNAHDGPLGSYADSGHDTTHPHMAHTDPDGNFVFISDLGTDRVFIYKFDKVNGKLTPNDQPYLQASPGAGPRHFVFHPNRRWAYVLNEESSTILFTAYDAAKGTLEIKQSSFNVPEKFAGTNYPSAIKLSSDGRFLYAANRNFNSIAIYEINVDGWMIRVGDEWTRGHYPFDIALDPSGNFMYAMNTNNDCVTSFRVDRTTGKLAFTGQFVPVSIPRVMVFLTL
ncbi:MAG: lactonase family protein [Bryobacterales bacterium]|nr:lactonase family protein [Bryobacterales bacterium]